jgi:hypothetical protein
MMARDAAGGRTRVARECLAPMSESTSGLLASLLLAAALGVLAVALGPGLTLLVVLVLGLVLLGLLVRFRGGAESAQLPVATLLMGVAILFTAWMGVRGPSQVPISDIPLLMALPLIFFAALRQTIALPIPPWLLWVAGGFVVSALLETMFVVTTPPRVLAEQSAIALGATASRASDLALLLRIEYSFVVIPVAIGAVSATWTRSRRFADLWLVSAAVCALIGCLDRLAGTGIGPSLVGNLEGLQLGVRATGLTAHPNYLGLFAAMAVPLAIARVFQTSGLLRVMALAATGVLLLAVQLSGSRLGIVAMLLGVAILFVLIPRFRLWIALGSVSVAFVGAIVLVVAPSEESALQRLSGDRSTDVATGARFRVIDEALENGLDHPLTGIGFGRILDSHSIPVQFLQSGGIIALASLLLWWFGVGRLGWILDRGLEGRASRPRRLRPA